MQPYQRAFIDFLISCEALQFGEFTLKNGRTSPYFVTTGKFDTGGAIGTLGHFYASAIHEQFPDGIDVIFGPAYKGIPLAVAAASEYARAFEKPTVGYTFNRKEEKTHGDKGVMVGRELLDGDRVVIVDDVFTTGETKVEAVSLLKATAAVNIKGLIVAVDRREKGKNGENAIADFTRDTGIPVSTIVTIYDILEHLRGTVITAEQEKNITAYLNTYGIT